MTHPSRRSDIVVTARFAGALYLVIIVAGLGAELGLRGQLIDIGDAQATAEAILAGQGRFRLAIGADLVMAICDVGLAILLFQIFRPAAPGLASAAMVFRLIQTVLIAVSLLALQMAWLLIAAPDISPMAGAQSLALVFIDLHGHGYDLGLVFFGVNSLMTGLLIWRSGLFARVVAVGIGAAGVVYLIGSGLRFCAPELSAVFAPAYAVTILAETVFCISLLGWRRRVARTTSASAETVAGP